MRLLVGMPDPGSLGGPAACEQPFVETLRGAGTDVTEAVYVYGDRFDGITLAQRILRVLCTARKFRRLVRSTRYDLVHLNTAFDLKAMLRDVVCVTAIRSSTKVLFLKLHGSDSRLVRSRNPLVRMLRRLLFAQVDAVGVLSSDERQTMIDHGVSVDKIVVVRNVVPAVELDSATQTIHEAPQILFIARMVPTKGLLDVIRACRILQKQGREFSLVCVGDGPARAEAEHETVVNGLYRHVRFVGYVPEVEARRYYATSDVLVFPSYHEEGFPLTIFNAVAFGLPVLTTRIRAAADYLSEPENCLWVKPQDPVGLSERIGELLDRPMLRESMRRNNLTLGRRFTAEKITAEYIELYRSLTRATS